MIKLILNTLLGAAVAFVIFWMVALMLVNFITWGGHWNIADWANEGRAMFLLLASVPVLIGISIGAGLD